MTTPTTARPTDGSHLPVIHLNGSGRQALLEQQHEVYTALGRVLVALDQATPHGRDYYPLGADAFTRAVAEHRRRVDAVQALRDDTAEDYSALIDR